MSTCYVAGNRRGSAPEELVSAGPFDIGLNWRKEVAAARRLRSDAEAASRAARPAAPSSATSARRELGAAGAPALAAKTESAARALGERPARRGRPVPCRQRRLARRLRVHQGARRAGADRDQGRRAGQHRPPDHHRVGAGRAEPRLDPRLPHGRAGHHQLRPRPAQPVPRRPRGHGRRHPGRPRRRRDHRRRRARPGAGAAHHPGRQRRHQPAELPAAGRQRPGVVQRAPAVRRRGPADRRARLAASPAAAGSRASCAGPSRDRQGRGRAAAAAAARQAGDAGRPSWRSARPTSTGRWSTSSCTACTPSARRSTRSTTCWRSGPSSTPDDQATFELDPRAVDWPTYITEIHLPSIVAARPGQDHAGQDAHRPQRPPAPRRALARPPRRRVRPGEHADRQQRGGELLVARHPPAERAGAGPLRAAHAGRGAAAAVARPQGPRRLPALLLPALRGRPGRRRSTRTRPSCSAG